MYYLLGGDSMLLLDGTLKDSVICKKEGSIFRNKWVPILSTVQLEKLGLLEKAQRHLKSGDEGSLFADAKIMSCAYRPGPNPDGDVLDIMQLTAMWMKASGIADMLGSEDLAGKQNAVERINAYSLNMKIGFFVKEAEYQLMSAGPEISPEKFNEVMINALQKKGLLKEIEWQVKHKSWRR
jgi:hypothetical protein